MPLYDAVGINCKKCATTENQGAQLLCHVCGLSGVSMFVDCVCVI